MDVTIVQGVSGAGKSTLALSMVANNRAWICSADQYFVCADGTYDFRADQLGDAHNWCFARYLNLVRQSGCEHIVVDNTNLNPVDVAPYIAVASALGIPWKILQVGCDPELAATRNVHGLTRSKVNKQYERMMAFVASKHWWPHIFAHGDLRFCSALARRNSAEEAKKKTRDSAAVEEDGNDGA